MGPSRSHAWKESRETSNRKYLSKTILACRERQAKNICFVQCMREYVSRTEKLRTTNKLLISTIKPYGVASKQTVSRWIKLSMQKAGVHDCFKMPSMRASSSSMANQRGVSLETIAKSAGWTGARTFAKYFKTPLSKADTMPRAIQSCLNWWQYD